MRIKCSDSDPYSCDECGKYISVQGLILQGHIEGGVQNEDYHAATKCPRCGGMYQKRKIEESRLHDYMISQFQDEIDTKASSERLKSLRGEIAIMRLLIQKLLNTLTSDEDWIAYSGKIETLLGRCEKLVTAFDRIEQRSDLYLDAAQLTTFVSTLLIIIQRYVKDRDTLQAISSEIGKALKNEPVVDEAP